MSVIQTLETELLAALTSALGAGPLQAEVIGIVVSVIKQLVIRANISDAEVQELQADLLANIALKQHEQDVIDGKV